MTSNSDTQRLRLAWGGVLRKNKLELMTGQSWTMLLPNRKGLSPLPADIFLTQGVDPNLHAGLTWSRNPQFRLIYHASDTVTLRVVHRSLGAIRRRLWWFWRDRPAVCSRFLLWSSVEYREQYFRSA